MSEADISTLSQLDEASRQQINKFIEQETAKVKIQTTVTQFTDMCFKKCITTVQDGNLNPTEEACVSDCLNRFLDTNIRVVQMIQNMPK